MESAPLAALDLFPTRTKMAARRAQSVSMNPRLDHARAVQMVSPLLPLASRPVPLALFALPVRLLLLLPMVSVLTAPMEHSLM
jgi:hypothetical protein